MVKPSMLEFPLIMQTNWNFITTVEFKWRVAITVLWVADGTAILAQGAVKSNQRQNKRSVNIILIHLRWLWVSFTVMPLDPVVDICIANRGV